MPSDALTINEAAATTGWSARMLRYIESIGLVAPRRSPAGYRLYGAAELQRLRTLRELLDRHGVALGEVGFARRLRDDRALARAVEGWLTAAPGPARRRGRRRLAALRAGQAHAPPRRFRTDDLTETA